MEDLESGSRSCKRKGRRWNDRQKLNWCGGTLRKGLELSKPLVHSLLRPQPFVCVVWCGGGALRVQKPTAGTPYSNTARSSKEASKRRVETIRTAIIEAPVTDDEPWVDFDVVKDAKLPSVSSSEPPSNTFKAAEVSKPGPPTLIFEITCLGCRARQSQARQNGFVKKWLRPKVGTFSSSTNRSGKYKTHQPTALHSHWQDR